MLSVKVLGGRSEQYTKDRHVGFDTYTTLADASVSFMLYDVADQKIIKSGIANGVSSVHGRLGKPLKGLTGPNAADAIEDLAADAPPTKQSSEPSVAPLVLNAPARQHRRTGAGRRSATLGELVTVPGEFLLNRGLCGHKGLPASSTQQLERTWGTPGRPSDTGAVSPATRSGNADYSSGAAPTCGLASSRETWPGQGHIV